MRSAKATDGKRQDLTPLMCVTPCLVKECWLVCCLLYLSGLVAGCATLSQEECLRGDWYFIGWRDADRGYPSNRLSEHRTACAEYRVSVDTAAYEKGYQAGLQVFCTPARGCEYGRQGKYYQNICPPALEPGFLNNYRLGYELNSIETDLSNIESQINSIKNELHNNKDKDKDKDQRRGLRDQREQLRYRQNSLQQQRDSLSSQFSSQCILIY